MSHRVPDGEPLDDYTLEAIAEWLELGLSAYELPPKTGRRLAERLRSGEWVNDPDHRNRMQVLARRVDEKLALRAPLTDIETAIAEAKSERARIKKSAQAVALARQIAELERHANNPKGQET